jgi:hypothetical protein
MQRVLHALCKGKTYDKLLSVLVDTGDFYLGESSSRTPVLQLVVRFHEALTGGPAIPTASQSQFLSVL